MSRMKLTKEQVSRLRYMYNKDYSYRAMSKALAYAQIPLNAC